MDSRKVIKTRTPDKSFVIVPLVIGTLCLFECAVAQQSSTVEAATPVPFAKLDAAPAVTLYNGELSARIYLPDDQHGFYQGTRFDRAGVIGSLRYHGHDFYVPWFDAVSPAVRDFVYDQGKVIVSPNTAAIGPVEEFNGEGGALGYAEAAPGGTFIKIGVGVLERVDDSEYDRFHIYKVIDAGHRTNTVTAGRADFLHVVSDAASGYGYEYTKTIRLDADKPVMFIEHTLVNTGSKAIDTTVYDHNFLNIDGAGTGPGLELRTAFPLVAEQPPDPKLAEIVGNRFVYHAAPAEGQRVATRLSGFGSSADDYDFHIAHSKLGAGMRIKGDRPLTRATLWSIPPVMSVEPFIAMHVPPGESFTWAYRYEFENGGD